MTDLQDVHMGHKEGWARSVNATPRVQPERLTARKHSALSPSRKANYDKQRRDWHANMGVLRTPQLRGLHDTLWDIVDSNLHDNDRAKGAVAIEGAAGLGKSTAVEQFAKEFHLREVAENGPRTAVGNERWRSAASRSAGTPPCVTSTSRCCTSSLTPALLGVTLLISRAAPWTLSLPVRCVSSSSTTCTSCGGGPPTG